jgi:hypothetical protein
MLNTLKSPKRVAGEDQEMFKMRDPRKSVCDFYVLLL